MAFGSFRTLQTSSQNTDMKFSRLKVDTRRGIRPLQHLHWLANHTRQVQPTTTKRGKHHLDYADYTESRAFFTKCDCVVGSLIPNTQTPQTTRVQKGVLCSSGQASSNQTSRDSLRGLSEHGATKRHGQLLTLDSPGPNAEHF